MGADLAFETGAATDVGHGRATNEDRFLVHAEAGVWAVADGMGGHAGGALASAAVVDALRGVTAPRSGADLLRQCERAAVDANARIRGATEPGQVAGTTLVALLVHGDAFAGIWSGDSRLYRVRAGAIEQWTEDHTEVQDLLAAGAITPAQAETWPRRHVVTRALGVRDVPELDIRDGELRAGDAFVLCSDGLSNDVPPGDILARVAAAASAQAAADALLALALARGCADNVTAVVVRCLAPRERTVVLPGKGARDGV